MIYTQKERELEMLEAFNKELGTLNLNLII